MGPFARTAAWVHLGTLGAVVALSGGLVAARQVPPSAARAAILRGEIARAPATRIDPRILRAPVGRPAEPAPAPPAAEAPPATPAPPAEAPPAATTDTAPEIVPTASLTRGQLLHVALDARQESEAQGLVRERLATLPAANTAELKTFSGVLRQVAQNDTELQLKPFVLVGTPLTYSQATGTFEGSVVVGVADVTGSTAAADLSVPLTFEVVESGERATLNRLSPPFERFKVSTAARGEAVTIRIASNFSREGVSVTVPVAPTLFVEVDNDSLRGLGMQSTRVTVRAVGPPATDTRVSLSAPGAFLDNDIVPLDEHGLGHAVLRSDRSGSVTLRATATGYVAAEHAVQVDWPWQSLASTCLGGLIGGFLRLAPGIRRGMKGGRLGLGLAIGALMGLLVFALHVLGVKLLPVTFAFDGGDLFAFASGALGGWLGTVLLPARPARAS